MKTQQQQKQLNKKQYNINNNKGMIQSVLNQSQIAYKITILLPQSLSQSLKSINKPLITQYLHNKILNKKIKQHQTFTALYLGKQQPFQIIHIQPNHINNINHITHNNIKDIKDISNNNNTKNINNDQIIKQKQEQNKQILNNENSQIKQKSYVVKQTTKIQLQIYSKHQSKLNQNQIQSKTFQTQYLSSQIQYIKLAVISSLKNRFEYIQNGLGPLKAIIISGFSGTGKSTLVKNSIISITQYYSNNNQAIYSKTISSINLLSKVIGGAQQYIRTTFTQLKQKQPSILVIEDLHLLFSQKQISSNRTAMAALISQLQSINQQQLIVIGTVNSDYQIAAQLKGSGKFQKQISLNLPNHHQRLKILQSLTQSLNTQTQLQIEDLKTVNLRMNGFSIGQIKQIIRQAYTTNNNKISRQAIQVILKNYKPSQIKQLIVQVPQVFWNDIGGYQHVKSQIKKVAELPLKHPQVFKRFGIEPIKGIMLYGPPGCSKTMMAKAIATETKLNFIGVKGPQLFSKYVGDSQKAVRNIFKRARACSPCIIFFDQIDAIAAQRSSNAQVSDRVLCQLLNQMDGIQGLKQVIIIAATNKPQILDSALTRPGRFDYMIYVSPPDLEARKQIFKIYLSKNTNRENSQELATTLASKTDGYTGAQISLVCRQSALIALQQNLQCTNVLMSHYELALKKIKRRLSIETIAKYRNFQQNLKY